MAYSIFGKAGEINGNKNNNHKEFMYILTKLPYDQAGETNEK